MTAPSLLEFEDALIARLLTRVEPDGPFRVVEVEQGQLVDAIRNSRIDGPSVFVHIESAEDQPETSSTFKREVQLQLFVLVMNYRGRHQARRGAGGDVGALQLLGELTDLLGNTDPGLSIQPLQPLGFHALLPPEQRPKSTTTAAAQGPVAAYRFDWRATWIWSRPADDDELAAVDHTHTDMAFDAHADGSTQLTDTATHPEDP